MIACEREWWQTQILLTISHCVPSGLPLWLVYAHTTFTTYPFLPWPVLCLPLPVLASLSSQVPTFFNLHLLLSAISSCPSVPFTSSPTLLSNPAGSPLHASPPSTSSLWLPFPYCPRLPFNSVSGVFAEPVLAFSLLLWLNRGIMARCLQH